MWDRALFALRRFSLDIGGHIGSWRLSVAIMIVTAIYYLFLVIWSISSPREIVRNIAALVPFWLVYGLLLLNTAVCLWRRLPRLRRELSRRPVLAAATPATELPVKNLGLDVITQKLRARGFWVEPESGRLSGARLSGANFWGVRHRWAALGTYLFHGAFFLLAAGFLTTHMTRQEARIRAAVGENFVAEPDQVLSRTEPRIPSGSPLGVRFRIDSVEPEFWRNEMLFTRLEADLEMDGGSRKTTRINQPVMVGLIDFLRLTGFGYALRYEIVDRAGQVIDSAFVKLDVFPPGQRDHFVTADLPHRFYVEVLPDYLEVDGEATTRSLNLIEPAVILRVFRGRIDLGRTVLAPGEHYEFEGMAVRFPEIRYWSDLTIVRDPGAPIIFAGYALGLLGLLLKIRGGRQEVEYTAGENGRGVLRAWGVGEDWTLGLEDATDPERQS